MDDLIIILILLVIIGLAVFAIYRSKKSGKKCIGCPDSGCSGRCSGCSSSGGQCNGSRHFGKEEHQCGH